ncbi:MAG: 4a-hydroxytetrahydrobiopterin dehydratase, partial [Pseudomonadota bacterium]
MAKPQLTAESLAHEIKQLTGWTIADDGKSITRHFKFGDFREAFAFMTNAALMAEKLDHHPEWFN